MDGRLENFSVNKRAYVENKQLKLSSVGFGHFLKKILYLASTAFHQKVFEVARPRKFSSEQIRR